MKTFDRRRNTTVDGQNFNLTDVEILELANKTTETEFVDDLEFFLDTHYDGDRLMDFDLDNWREEHKRQYAVRYKKTAQDPEDHFEVDGLHFETFDRLEAAKTYAKSLISKDFGGVWIDVLKPNAKAWVYDYHIETGELQ
tara:strand:+ start:2259 stop:2678 length:420 start_codon:yes stop_codon:yes gene_type:complete